jgi:hypothetical protein
VKNGFSFGLAVDVSDVKSQFSFGSGSAVSSTQKADSDTKIASPFSSLFLALTGESSVSAIFLCQRGSTEEGRSCWRSEEGKRIRRSKQHLRTALRFSDYSDRCVGKLYLKKINDFDRIQLIVHAGLSNILLNLILTSGLPASRMGKNNVTLVCIPTPDTKPPPVPI